MSCEANPPSVSHSRCSHMAIMAYTDSQGTCEVITGPFTTLTRRISSPIPALRGPLIYWSICEDCALECGLSFASLWPRCHCGGNFSLFLAAVQRQFAP